MININYLKPKAKYIPEILIYSKKMNNNTSAYRMFNIKTGDILGDLVVTPKDFYKFNFETPAIRSLEILYLKIFERNKKYGTKFLNFAKIISKQQNCNGNLHLISSNCYDKKNPPHIFYRKYGFDSRSIDKLNQIDKAILSNNTFKFNFDNIGMFYPAQSKIGEFLKEPLLKRFLNSLIKKFTY